MNQANILTVTPGKDPGRSGLWQFVDAGVLLRASVVAVLLGSVLTLVNQPVVQFGDGRLDQLQLVLAYATPFVVVVISQALGMRRATIDAGSVQSTLPVSGGESFIMAAASHGIPLRSLSLGLGVGSLNTALAAFATMTDGGRLTDLQITPTAQAFILPMVFGLISQTISYRRMARAADGQSRERASLELV